jgi:uncharacterized protein YqkB
MAVTFTQRAADRISRAIKWVEQQIRTQGNTEGTVTPRSVEPTYVLTTSGTATSGFYPGKVVLYSAADAAWQEYSTCKILPANGETLTNNTRYAARYTGRNSGGDGVFTVLQGGGGLTTEEADGSPSYTGVTKLQFDQADGFVLSNPSTGTVKVDIAEATASQAGIVGTGSQTFGGKKAFNNQIVSHNSSGSTTSGQVILARTTGTSPTEYLSIWAEFTSTSTALRFTDDSLGNYASFSADASNSWMSLYGPLGGSVYLNSSNTSGEFSINIADLSFGAGIYITSSTSYFWCKRSSTSYNGATGTIGSSAKVAGGIVYSLGTVAVQSSSWMGF